MRRCLFLFAAVVAGVVATAPAAHAHPICATAWTYNPDIQMDEPACVDYAYGVWCDTTKVWNDDTEAYVYMCYPAPF